MGTSSSIRRIRVAALLLVALGMQAHATVLCVNRKGVIVADERCRKRETQLDPGELGFVGRIGAPGPVGPAGPAGPTVERLFRVLDANGKTVCTPLSRRGPYLQCVLEPDPQAGALQLVLRPDGGDSENPSIYYAAPGCEGPPFTNYPPAVLARAKLLGTRVFFAAGPRASFTYRSYEFVYPACIGGTPTPYGTCCQDLNTPVTSNASPARSVELSALGLTAPVRVEEQ
jgi:hypothetical protein